MTDAQKRFIWIVLTMLSGPALNIAARKFHLAADDVKDILDILSVITLAVGAAWGYTALNPAGVVRSASTLPGVSEIVVKPGTHDGLAKAAQDPAQPKVVTKLLALVATGVLLLGAGGGLTACASTDGPGVDHAAIERGEAYAELVYTGAKVAVGVLCATSPSVYPCSSPAAMAEIARATEVLDQAFVTARKAIAAARTENAITVAILSLADAAALYGKVMATYGLSRGGG